jgi:hypothetical protein
MLVRDFIPADGPFVTKSWVTASSEFIAEQFKLDPDEHRAVSELVQAASHASVTQKLRDSTVRLVACDPADPGSLFGFIVGDPGPNVHYVFTRYPARRLGVARELYRAFMERVGAGGCPIACTSWGFTCAGLAPRYALIYSPLQRPLHPMRNR